MAIRRLILITLFTLLLLTGCQRPGVTTELPDDGPAPPVSQAAAENFGRKLGEAARGAQESGTLSLSFTDQEITSLLTLGQEAIESEAREQIPTTLDVSLPLTDPVVYFRGDGRMIVRGGIELAGRRQDLRLVVAPRASAGELELDFVEGQVGALPVPEAIFDQVGGVVASLILAGQDVAEISSLTVSEGQFSIQARVNR